jgi:hypothetical protein
MGEQREPWYANGWVVGTGTAVVSVFILKALDWIFGTRIVANVTAWLVASATLPMWLVVVLVGAGAVAGWLIRYTAGRSRAQREKERRLRIVASPFACGWSDAKKGEERAIMLDLHATATNVSEVPVYVPRAYVVKPRSDAFVLVKAVDSNMHGNYAIPPGETTDIVAHFGIHPPIARNGEEVVVDIAFVDNFENAHRLRKVKFLPPPAGKKRVEYAHEAVHAIEDPVEKQAVAVLKAEVARYQRIGRGTGGIGSVHTIRDGRTIAGVPSDGWTHGSHENSYITRDPNSQIASENADALENLFRRLQSDDDRVRFVRALTSRIKANTEYASVAYLPLLALLRVGKLPEALTTAKAQLRGDSELGFDEFVRVLAALLTNQHQVFSDTDLDEIERFAEGLTEYAYEIPARVAAVRALRVR